MVQLTKRQSKFFHKPRTMAEIMNLLFNGDAWAANDFQNVQLNAGNLETCTIENPKGAQYGKLVAIKKAIKPA